MAVLKKKKKSPAPLRRTAVQKRKKAGLVKKTVRSKVRPTSKKKIKPIIKKVSSKKKIAVKTQKKPNVIIRTISKKTGPELARFFGNPIIEPNQGNIWESKATFNPSAIIHENVVHLVYRAIGDADVSVLGYATSNDGFTFKKQSARAIYSHSDHTAAARESAFSVEYISGGGWSGGCEDPRLVKIGDTVYMTYTAFDGWNSVRIALTSILLTDFIAQRWNWKKSVLISAPGEINNNWTLFPEKINGKYAMLHSISPHILIEYIDDLKRLDGTTFIKSIHRDNSSWELRDKGIRGIGPAPIRTKDGWLVMYHGTEEKDLNKYKIWAMLLDLDDPTKIVYKTKRPILEPEEMYETIGHRGIVYSCGAVIKDGTLFVYYGGGDRVTCVATAHLNTFLNEISTSGTPRLTPEKKIKK